MKNKLTRLLLHGILLLSALTTNAQEMKQFTLEELNYGGKNYRKTVPENRYTAWWGDTLVRLDAEQCSIIDKRSGKETPLFTLEEINTWCQLDSKTKVHSLYYADFPYPDKPLVMLRSRENRMLVDFKQKQLIWTQSVANQQAADFHAQTKATAFVRNNQLYIANADGEHQITTDGSCEIVYGQSVHRNEFGISKGTFWSPDGSLLAFYRMDQSMVKDYPQVDIFQRTAEYQPDKYPMAGETSHEVTIGVYNIATRQTIYLNCGNPKDRYFTNIQWSPDNKKIYLFELNRDQNDCQLAVYDAQTGEKLGIIYREQHEKYVEPLHPIVFLPWDASKFILQSQRDGYNHLYLYNTKGDCLKQLTKGPWVVMDMLGFNEKKQSVIYLGNEASPIQANLYSVSLKTGRRTLLDNGKGYHNGSLSFSGQFVLDSYSEPTVPRQIDILATDKPHRTSYFTAADPWKEYIQPQFLQGTIKAADGQTDLYYRMVRPADFDETKQYPTVIYVYGGPHAHNVDARWHYASRSWETYMAQKGYIVFILDNRGSENRGREFEQATFRQLGQVEMQDQMKGVEYLQSLPYIDKDRMGVHGWSFGGFMTMTLMLNHPEVFKVGVAGGPVIDWKYYEVMYGERYMDTPQQNPEGYEKSSLLGKAKDLKGHLQIITGYNDDTVVPQNCLDFLAHCIEAGTQPDFFVYPGEPHNMRGHASVHLHERITNYFETYLK